MVKPLETSAMRKLKKHTHLSLIIALALSTESIEHQQMQQELIYEESEHL